MISVNTLTRRGLLKAMGTAGLLVATGQAHRLARAAAAKVRVPPRDNRFRGVTLNMVQDSVWGPVGEWYSDELTAEAGVGFGRTEIYPIGQAYEKIFPELISGRRPRWDLLSYPPLHLGDFVATGGLEPLDKYFEEYEGVDEYWADVLPAAKEFYTRVHGEIFAIPVDGDVHNLFYRPSFFNNETYRRKFENRFGYPLGVPKTWRQFNDIARFFTEELSSQGIYGCQIWGKRPWNWAFYFDYAAGNGVKYFDEEMNPLINSPEAVEALEAMVESKRWSPPGAENFGDSETISNWQQGRVVMSVWWIDLAEFSARGNLPVLGDQANARMPGWEKGGRIVARAMMPYFRVLSIPRNLPADRKRSAFYAAYRLSHKDYSFYSAADPFCGTDPYMYSHYTDAAAEQYLKPNPYRGVTPDYPRNDGIFNSFEEARRHLDGGLANMEIGFPQPNWPGATEYTNALGIWVQRALAGDVTPKQALDSCAKEWSDIVKKLGRSTQLRYYRDFVDAAKRLGYW